MTKRKSKKLLKDTELHKMSGGGRGASARRPTSPAPSAPSTPSASADVPSGGDQGGGGTTPPKASGIFSFGGEGSVAGPIAKGKVQLPKGSKGKKPI